MAFYEHTQITKIDVKNEAVEESIKKYSEVINDSSGKIVKVEKWGPLNFAKKIGSYNKGIYTHFKFEGNKETLENLNKKVSLDQNILRHLTVKYKKLNLEDEYFKSENKSK